MPDPVNPLPLGLRTSQLAWSLALLGTCLIAIFVIMVMDDVLPPLVLDPRWQFGLANVLVSNCSFPLVGLGLWHLAGYLAPDEDRLQKFLDRLARLAVLATLGYLLLIPLQAWSLWSGVDTVNRSRGTQLNRVLSRAEQMQAAVRAAGSVAELQSRLRAMQGPELDAASLNQPLPALKQQLLGAIAQVRAGVERQSRAPRLQELWSLGKQGLRSSLLALVAALGLASFSRVGPEGPSLLQMIHRAWLRGSHWLVELSWLERWSEARADRAEERQTRQRLKALRRMRRHFEDLEQEEGVNEKEKEKDKEAGRRRATTAPPLPDRLLHTWQGRPLGVRPPKEDSAYLGKLLEQAELEEREALARRNAAAEAKDGDADD